MRVYLKKPEGKKVEDFGVQNSRVIKSSYEIGLHKMASFSELLTRKSL